MFVKLVTHVHHHDECFARLMLAGYKMRSVRSVGDAPKLLLRSLGQLRTCATDPATEMSHATSFK